MLLEKTAYDALLEPSPMLDHRRAHNALSDTTSIRRRLGELAMPALQTHIAIPEAH
jgi:hypothetical protein